MRDRTSSQAACGMRAALLGLLVDPSLVLVNLLAGIAGHSYASVADAIETSTDIFPGMVSVHPPKGGGED